MESEVTADQAEVFAFLADPATYGSQTFAQNRTNGAVHVDRIDTHGAVVFLAGPQVYKVKRAVRYPFMDFSTLEKRRAACENEVAVNRRNAPQIYLAVVAIRRDASRFYLGGTKGEITEWAVHMRRFDERQTFDRLADRGELDIDLMGPLAAAIASAHAKAPKRGDGATEMLHDRLKDTLEGLAASGDLFPAAALSALRQTMLGLFAKIRPLLMRREQAGKVRLCHGDLHLRNIVLYDGRPLLFDAIEFDESLATCDILYDFAFVLADLWQRGLHHHANRLFNLYLWRIDDCEAMLDALAALPLFLALRALIRARVTAALCRLEPEMRAPRKAEAQHFFAAAQEFIAAAPVHLVAVGGLSGSGKSTLAKNLAPSIGRAPGAVHLRSDIERKRLCGVSAFERLPAEAYQLGVTHKVYARLRDFADRALAAGQSVIIDAVHAKAEERDALVRLAAQENAQFCGFWLEAPGEVLIARAEARQYDASDATAAVVREQLNWHFGPMAWRKLDARKPVAELTKMARAVLA